MQDRKLEREVKHTYGYKNVPLPFVRVRQLQSDLGLVYGIHRHFQQYFSYIVAVSFIGGGNRSIPGENHRLPQVTDKLYFIILHRVHFA